MKERKVPNGTHIATTETHQKKKEKTTMQTHEMNAPKMKCAWNYGNATHLNKQHWLWLICPINEHLRSLLFFLVHSCVVSVVVVVVQLIFCFIIIVFFFILSLPSLEFLCITRCVTCFYHVMFVTRLFSLNSSSFWLCGCIEKKKTKE